MPADARRSSPKHYQMLKSINLWAFPYPQRMNLRECMQLAKDAGFDGIELNYDLENDLSQAQADANRMNQQADQMRAAAMPIEREGRTNIMAGEALRESGDSEGGSAVIARGEAKVAKAKAMLAEADQLDMSADGARAKADELAMEARDKLASLPND